MNVRPVFDRPAPGARSPLSRLRIRPAIISDRAAVADLIKRLRLQGRFDQKEYLVAEHRGRVVGCARLRFLGDSYELVSLGVRPSYRKRGVGTALLRACIDRADDRIFCLSATPAFFEQGGFRTTETDSIPAELVGRLRKFYPPRTVALVHGGNPMTATFRQLRDKCEKDIETTRQALDRIRIAVPRRSHYRKAAEDFLTMAKAYFSDAMHFLRKGDLVLAFACVNYAHGWLDSGARLGLFDVGQDDKLFTLAE